MSGARSYDAIILGAGAAGLYCAAQASQRGRRVLVLEHNSEPGAKIVISGGGRCNFTNVDATGQNAAQRFLSNNLHFARSALTRHPPSAFRALIQKHGIAYYEKTLGQLFCDGARSSQKIVRMLLDEAAGADLRLGAHVTEISKGDRFTITTDQGAFDAPALVVATGGLSIPKLGASNAAYDIAKQFSVPIIPPRPALVPLTFAERDLTWMRTLAGVSADAVVSVGTAAFREAALFTHRGLSGPSILQASSYWSENVYLQVDWLPDAEEDVLVRAKRERPNALPKTIVAQHVPERLAAQICAAHPPRPLGDWKDEALIAFVQRALKGALLKPTGTEGYAKAEVTVGGIDTNALSQQTMEARAVPGLFFIGEAVDVTGWLGGYNFQWAWSSGWAASQAL